MDYLEPDALRNYCDLLIDKIKKYECLAKSEIRLTLLKLISGIKEFEGVKVIPANGPSPTTFNINQLRGIYTVLEVFWNLGLADYVNIRCEPLLLPDEPYSKSYLIRECDINVVKGNHRCYFDITIEDNILELMDDIELLAEVCQAHPFITLMLPKYIKRIVVSILCLLHDLEWIEASSSKLKSTATHYCKLQTLLTHVTSKNVLLTVSHLRTLSSTTASTSTLSSTTASTNNAYSGNVSNGNVTLPVIQSKWMKARIGQLFSILLVSKSQCNLELILKGYLDGVTDGPHSTQIQLLVAKSIALPPKTLQLTNSEYYDIIVPQLLELLLYSIRKHDHVSKIYVFVL